MAEIKKINTEFQLLDKFLDTSGDAGTSGQVLSSTASGVNWVSGGSLPGGPYLPLSGGTLTGDITLDDGSGASPSIYLKNGDDNFWRIFNGSNLDLTFRVGTVTKFSIDNSGNGTFAGNISFGDSHFIGDDADDNLLIQGSASENVIIRSEDGLYFRTGGNNTRLTINSSGNVGIGTTSPGTILHVKGSTDSTEVKIDTNDNALGDDALIKFNGERAQVGWIDAAVTLTDGGGNKDIKLKVNTGSIFLQTNNTNRLSVLDGGNVGIGTISPSEKLHVAGYAKADTGFKAGNYTILNESGNETSLSNTAYYPMFFKTNNSTRMTISNAGNVGIGTTSPGSLLHLSSSTGPRITLTDTDASIGVDSIIADISFVGTEIGGETARIGAVSETSGGEAGLRFYTGQSVLERLRIDKDGNVGIGTTSPGQKLDVNGSINVSSNVFAEGFYGDRLWNSNNAALRFGTNNTERARIDGNGRLLINATSTAFNDTLYVNSDAYATGGWRVGTSTTYVGKLINDGGKLTLMSDGSRDVQIGNNNNPSILYVDTSEEKVGIGTTSPNAKLNVNGNIKIEGTNSLFFGGGASVPSWAINSSGNDLIINDQATTSGDVLFTNDGNVGIGTTSPSRNLEVSGVGTGDHTYIKILGDTTKEAVLELHADSDAAGDRWRIASGNSARLDFRNNGSTKVSFQGGGNVGIGTTSPTNKLHIQGSQATVYSSTDSGGQASAGTTINNTNTAGNTNNFSQLLFTVGTNNNSVSRIVAIRSGSDASDLAFVGKSAAGVAEYMRIKSGGNVGIGTTSPGSSLEVLKSASSTTISEARISSLVTGGYGGQANLWLRTSTYGSAMLAFGPQVGSSTVASSASGKISYNTFTRVFTVTADSNALLTLGGSLDRVGINQTSPLYTLDVTGNGRFTSTVTATNFINSSDERLKENIEEVCNNNVEVNWKTFNFKAEKEQKRYGVIAQELEKTNPEFVREDSKGFKSVAYIDLLIAKIAELEARIQKLEK